MKGYKSLQPAYRQCAICIFKISVKPEQYPDLQVSISRSDKKVKICCDNGVRNEMKLQLLQRDAHIIEQ